MMAEEFALIAFFAVVSVVGVTSLFLVTTKLRLQSPALRVGIPPSR